MTGRRGEEGAGVVLVIGVVALLVALSVVCSGAAALVAGHRRAQVAAELAALAGAGADRSGLDPCAAAGRIAVANGTGLAACSDASGVVEVVVEVEVMGTWMLSGRARAGPASER